MKIRTTAILLFVFFLFFSIYALFRSPDFMAVDGPLRSCAVYHSQDIFFHENNHLIYPVNVWAWDRISRVVLGECHDPLEFAQRTQLMNGFATAASVAILFALMRGATGSIGIALLTACSYGFSRAVLLHATNAAEPPVGLMFGFLALAAVALAREGKGGRVWLAAMAGVFLAAAMASYQTMILIGPAVLLLCAAPGSEAAASKTTSRGQIVRVLGFFFGCIIGVVCIYGWAYNRQGLTGLSESLRHFFAIVATDVYGGFSMSKIVNTPVGMIGNLFYAYPSDYAGVRSVLHNHAMDGWAIWLGVLLFSCSGGVLLLASITWKHRNHFNSYHRLFLAVTSVGLATTIVGPLYWSPTYDKLWLQPIAAIVSLVGLTLAALPPSRGRRAIAIGCILLVIVQVASNCLWLIPDTRSETPYLSQARQVDNILQPDDLLVHEWDGVSTLYSSLYGHEQPTFCLPTVARERGIATAAELQARIRQVEDSGGHTYFLGVLDHTVASWEPFLGARLGVPFHAFDDYRDQSHVVVTFQVDNHDITLRLFNRAIDNTNRTN